MSNLSLRITPEGVVRGLWSDAVDWQRLGNVSVERASRIEFCDRRQRWQVRAAVPRISPATSPKPDIHQTERVLFESERRGLALVWEHAHFSPGGPGWPSQTLFDRKSQPQ